MLMVTETCPTCGEDLDGDNAAGGLCAACLLERAIDFSSTVSLSDRSTPGPLPFTPPETVEVEADLLSYDVLELVGRGGMGAVYKARQRNLDRVVAIKVLPRNAGTPEFADRFQREARALARLRHENIVMAYDFGLTERYSYCVMEFVAGPNLRELMRRGPLMAERALAIARDVCRAMEYAHSAGIVHRDIKPENVLLTESGEVKLADFGLAKLLERDELDFALTCTQHFMGTLHYMAPEQCERPHETDHRADIYSVGVLLYEMITGELPLGRFDSPSIKRTVGEDVDTLVLRALEKDPAKRFPTGGEFAEAIESVLEKAGQLLSVRDSHVMPADAPVPLIDSSGHRPRRRVWIAAGLFGLLAIVFLGWQFIFNYERDKDGNTKLSLEARGADDERAQPTQSRRGAVGRIDPANDQKPTGELSPRRDAVLQTFKLKNTPAREAEIAIRDSVRDFSGRIAVDERTNSVLVEADGETMNKVKAVLRQLDVPIDVESFRKLLPSEASSYLQRLEKRISVLADEFPNRRKSELEEALLVLGDSTDDSDEMRRRRDALRREMNEVESQSAMLRKIQDHALNELERLGTAYDWPDLRTNAQHKSRIESADQPVEDRPTNTPGRLDPGEVDQPAHKIQRGDGLSISAAGALADRPIDGVYTVDVDGYVNLGGEYGKVRVAGMTADKAQDAVIAQLSKILRNPAATITIASTIDRLRGSGFPGSSDRRTTPRRNFDPNTRRTGPVTDPNAADRQNIPNDPTNPVKTVIQDGQMLKVAADGRILESRQLTDDERQMSPIEIAERDGHILAPESDFEDRPAVLPRPDWTEAKLNAKSWPERKEDLPIAIRLADDVKKQLGRLAVEYRFYDSPPVVIPSKEGDIVIPYILVVSGDHLGRKEYVMSQWPVRKEHNTLDRTPGILFAPRSLRINNGDPVQIYVERGDPRTSTRVRVSNIVKLKWEIPGAPTADIRYPKNLMAPVSAIHWDDSRPAVEIENEWYELLGIDGMKASAFVEVAKEKAGDKWQQKFENELPELLKEAGVLSLDAFVLNLRRLSDGREHTFAVQMQDNPTGKRQAVITRRHNLGIGEFHDRAGKPLGGPTLLAPFSGVGWKDGLPRVQLNGVWYDLSAISGFRAESIIDHAKKTYPSDHQRGFEENLEAILKDLGQKDFDTVQITLRRVDSGRIERIMLRRANKTYGIMSRMVTGQQIPGKRQEEPKAQDKAATVLTAATGPEPLRKIQWKRNFPHVTIYDQVYALDRINNVLSARLMEEAKKMRPDDVPGAFQEEWPELMRRLKQPVGNEIELTVVGPVDEPGGGDDSAAGKILVVKYGGDSSGEWKLLETSRLSSIGPAKRLPPQHE